MELKLERRTFTVTKYDLILDNGACYQLITQSYMKDFSKQWPRVSKKLFKSLVKDRKLRLSKKKYRASFGDKEMDLYEFTL